KLSSSVEAKGRKPMTAGGVSTPACAMNRCCCTSKLRELAIIGPQHIQGSQWPTPRPMAVRIVSTVARIEVFATTENQQPTVAAKPAYTIQAAATKGSAA